MSGLQVAAGKMSNPTRDLHLLWSASPVHLPLSLGKSTVLDMGVLTIC
jgi:hypothetical protein